METEKALRQALSLLENRRFGEAEKLCRQILIENPRHADANYCLGDILKQMNQLVTAKNFFKTALEVRPTETKFWISFIDSLINLNRLEPAEKVLKEGQKKGLPKQVTSHLASRIDLEKKAVALKGVLASKPKNPEGLFNLGNIYNKLGKPQDAVKSYKQAIRANPKFTSAYFNLGFTLERLGELNLSIESYKQAITIKPDYAEAHFSLGNVCNKLGDFDAAIKSYKKAVSIRPSFSKAYYNLARTFQDKGDFANAINNCEKAIKLEPGNFEAFNSLGSMHLKLRQLDDAIISFEKALAIEPNSVNALNNLGAAFQEQGKLELALKTFQKALKINPKSAEALNNLGVSLRDIGELGKASKSFDQALNLKPKSTEILNNCGGTFKKLGETDKAIKYYKRALAINPNEKESNYELGTILLQTKRFEEAIHYYEKSKYQDWEGNLLLCLYKLERFEEFKTFLDQVVAKGKVSALIAALSQHYAENFAVKNPCNFCQSPLDYVCHAKVPKLLEDDSKLIKDLVHDIKTLKIEKRLQSRLHAGIQSSGNLLNRPENSFKQLAKVLKEMIWDYYVSHKHVDNQFIKNFPARIEFLSSWYIRMQSGGYLASHIHEQGWISGAVYLVIPESATNTPAGAIELSTDGDDYPCLHDRFRKRIIPLSAGDTVFFPSSVFHRTLPFKSEEERICIAFDIKTNLFTASEEIKPQT